jgi:hypothetical protein
MSVLTTKPTQMEIEYSICFSCDTVDDREEMVQCPDCKLFACVHCSCDCDPIVIDSDEESLGDPGAN